ncbi:TPR-like protein [Dacryopinax primogenitus]|uniref:TPR-like protein n=1 Tax=Dacryopinax primogenitus (strain DJM 731) TaxID=1858805 RepID=M5G0B6_DACPD|nr:TPR-like protein [Dacryopinax primogenitus]EJT97237.1 TPR-like protein [Dacryopinax primogenitus]
MSGTPTSRSSRRQSKPAERYNDGALSWEQVVDLFPEMDEEDGQESEISAGGSDYGEGEELGKEAVDGSTDGEDDEMMIDPQLLDQTYSLDDVEDAFQDDFIVLVDQMNAADDVGHSVTRKDFTMTEQDMDLRETLRAAARIGRRRRKGKRRARAQYSEEVRALLTSAQTAFVDQNPQEAIRIAREAVRIEPRAIEGWSVLAGVFAELGDVDAALKFRIMRAHMTAESGIWKDLAAESLALDLPRQALYCYRKLLQINPHHEDAIWDRAYLLKAMGELDQALKGFENLLQLNPHNPNVLFQIYQVCLESSNLSRALFLYQSAFDFFRKFPPNEELFGIPSLSILADLQISVGNLEGAIQTVKSGARWLQNRSNESFWDLIEDDREFDPPGFTREAVEGQEEDQPPGYHPLPFELRHRLAIARLKGGNDAEAEIHVDVLRALDRELHPEFNEYMMEIGDVYFERGLWEEAYGAYDDVHGSSELVSRHLLTQIGRCLRNLGRLKDAIAVLEQVLEAAPDSMEAKLDLVELLEANGQLERAYDMVLEIKESRQQHVNEGEEEPRTASTEAPVFKDIEKTAITKGPATLEESVALEEQRTEVALAIYERLQSFEEAAERGDPLALEEWMFQARRLIDIFRQTRMLFPSNPNRKYTGFFSRTNVIMREARQKGVDIDQFMADISSRLRDSMQDEARTTPFPEEYSTRFRGIGFDEWALLFLTYCFRLMRRGEYLEAENILRHTSFSNIFNTPKYRDTFNVAILAGAVFTGNLQTFKEQTRKIIFQNQFNNDAVRLFIAVLGTNIDAYITFTEPKLSKFLVRELKIGQAAAKGERLHTSRGRWVLRRSKQAIDKGDIDVDDGASEEEEEALPTLGSSAPNLTGKHEYRQVDLPTKENPFLIGLYGQILMAVRSYQTALFFFLHAYELDPHDPLLCLCLAVAYLGRSMQRQSDNRHHQIVQGLAFLTRYKTLRASSNTYGEEIEYNFGRYFHQIGVLHLATKHYRRVLDIARARMHSGQRIPPQAPVKEAAYNLSLIYATTGAADVSHVLYQEWLTI